VTVLLPNGVREVAGHPHLAAVNAQGRDMQITVCAECESMRSILWLANDRWYCRVCRNSGVARPTTIPLSRPGRR